MSDIFDEITADLRRDRLSEAWEKYGRYIIAMAVVIIIAVSSAIGIDRYQQTQREAASARYDVMQGELDGLSIEQRIARLIAFAEAESNGYGVLARFSAALYQAEQGQPDAALVAFDALARADSAPDSLRDLAGLQAAIVLLDNQGSVEDVEARLRDLLNSENSLLPMAREIMALAYLVHDRPLEARELFKAQIGDGAVSSFTRERATIMLHKVGVALSPESTATETGTE